MITQEYLKECISYDPSTGAFLWKKRPSHHYKSKFWHMRQNFEKAGRDACAISLSSSGGYKQILLDAKPYLAHRLAWLYVNGSMPYGQIDHNNRIKIDNRIENLRDVSCTENQRNSCLRINNTSGFNGVSWNDHARRWTASIKVDGNSLHLGCFEYKKDAISARKKANNHYGFHENHGNA